MATVGVRGLIEDLLTYRVFHWFLANDVVAMEELDADDKRLSYQGRVAERDIVQVCLPLNLCQPRSDMFCISVSFHKCIQFFHFLAFWTGL